MKIYFQGKTMRWQINFEGDFYEVVHKVTLSAKQPNEFWAVYTHCEQDKVPPETFKKILKALKVKKTEIDRIFTEDL